MKKTFFLICILSILNVCFVIGQNCSIAGPPISLIEKVQNSEYVFEGRVLKNDSVFFTSGAVNIITAHKILVLKQFKGNFKTDTLEVLTQGGEIIRGEVIDNDPGISIDKEYEGVFFVSLTEKIVSNIHYPNSFFLQYGRQGIIKVCDKKDVVKEVYEPIMQQTGQPYIDVHPNTCARQKK